MIEREFIPDDIVGRTFRFFDDPDYPGNIPTFNVIAVFVEETDDGWYWDLKAVNNTDDDLIKRSSERRLPYNCYVIKVENKKKNK